MRNVLTAFCVLALVAASGCGLGAVKAYHVTGKVTNGGKSPLPDPKNGLTITFMPLDPNARKVTYTAALGEDNSFEVFAPDGKGIPAGKYKVALMMMAPGAPMEAKVNDQFSSSKSPIEVDVTGDQFVDIDLAKYMK